MTQEIVLAPHAGTGAGDVAVQRAQEVARTTGKTDVSAWDRLGWAYVAKARQTLDPGFLKLAELTAQLMPADQPGTLLLRGHVLHQLHRFAEATEIARTLVTQRGSATDLALLSDLLVEQGKIPEATALLQRLVDQKPGGEAYSRISHVRWLTGDAPGAIAAMELAVRAVSPKDVESSAWMLCRLSGYWLESGATPRAILAATAADKRVADYPPALLALGRAHFAAGEIAPALSALRRAATLNPLPEYQWWLADVLRVAGETAEAEKVEATLLRNGEAADPRTYAVFLATRGLETATAVRLARDGLKERTDVFSHGALAWTLVSESPDAAAAAMERALAAGTRDARLWWHAGEIALRRGDRAAAQDFFTRAAPLSRTMTPSEQARLQARVADARRNSSFSQSKLD